MDLKMVTTIFFLRIISLLEYYTTFRIIPSAVSLQARVRAPSTGPQPPGAYPAAPGARGQ